MDENYKCLKEVVNHSYVIGSYQRGYRWDEVNVKELLEDIFEDKLVEDYIFTDSKYIDENEAIGDLKAKDVRKAEYCLQPLVLKKEGAGYSVIDGQQRLTTLYIVLKALCSLSDKKFPPAFTVEYKSREKSKIFLQNLSDDSSDDDIDSAYILQAYKYAKNWFLDRNKSFIDLLDQYYVDYDETRVCSAFATHIYNILLEKTKFIWDEIDESSADMNKKEQKIFADRNTGRLELTDSELIKSLFMNPVYYGKNVSNLNDRQTLISEIWDIYENELHNDELWEFIPISKSVREEYSLLTRIDVVFLLLIKRKKIAMNPYEENALFKAVKSWIDREIKQRKDVGKEDQSANVMISCWREVCDLFDGIKELFDNNEIYNLLSLYKMIEDGSDNVLETYMKVLDELKNKRTGLIKKSVCDKLFIDGIKTRVSKVRYPERDTIRKILVAHNIAITNSSTPIHRFGFHFFGKIKGKWDLEHIYSTNEGYIAKAPLEEQVKLLEIFSETDNNIYKQYIEQLYSININELQGEIEEKDFADNCFKKSQEKYDKYFDIWRYLKLKEHARDLLSKYSISQVISQVLESKRFDDAANDFIHDANYEDHEVFMLLRGEYLYWDDAIEEKYKRMKANNESPDSIMWHGYNVKISSAAGFWDETIEEKRTINFIQNYRRELLNIIYDNIGIQSQDITFGNHGPKREQIINDDNREKIRAFLKGTKERIEKRIQSFFEKDETINPLDNNLGIQANYKNWAAFVNDNSMGNMMLLPTDINQAGQYRDVNFSGKRKYVVNMRNVFLPVATSNVLMGKYIDLETSTEQWLMNERKEYLNDMIKTMQEYYGKE